MKAFVALDMVTSANRTQALNVPACYRVGFASSCYRKTVTTGMLNISARDNEFFLVS